VADCTQWHEVEAQILATLDIRQVYESLGVRFTGHPSARGWHPCHAIDREDANASAAVHVGPGPARGRYRDLGGAGDSYNLWEFAARYGGYGDWREARKYYAHQAAVTLPDGPDPRRPEDALLFTETSDLDLGFFDIWAKLKGGFDALAVQEAGGRQAQYPAKAKFAEQRQDVIAFPAFSAPGLLDTAPCGWVIAARTGQPVKLFRGKGKPPSLEKTLSVGGSTGGLLNAAALRRLMESTADADADLTIWKAEGLSDMLALHTAIRTAGLQDRHVVLTNSQGCMEAVKPEWVALLRGRRVYVVGDADRPGQLGAARWASALAGVAAEVRNVQLPYELAEKHGKDVRDFFADGHGLDDLLRLAREAQVVQPSAELPWATPSADPAASETIASNTTFNKANVSRPRRTLPLIRGNKRQLRDVTAEALAALNAANTPPCVFQRGVLTRLKVDPIHRKPVLEPLTESAIRGVLARVATWLATNAKGEVYDAPPPIDVVRDIEALPEWSVPPIESIIECPVFDRAGNLVDRPGYHADSRLWYHHDGSLTVPAVPDRPTGEDIAGARHLLLEEFLGDFPFADDSSRAHALAALLLPFCRSLIDGPTPLHLVSAPVEGSGKTLLANCIAYPATGRAIEAMTVECDEEEMRKRLTSTLVEAPAVVLLDNLGRTLDSATLASVLTARVWKDRILGVSRTVSLPVTPLWLATGNNPTLSRELVRRTILSRLDAKVENPYLRLGFRHPDLTTWAKEHRGGLVHAALVLIRAWIAAGRPAGSQTLGMYENWARVLGGILDVAGVPGLLANAREARQALVSEVDEWDEFVAAWWRRFQTASVGVKDLFSLAERDNLLEGVMDSASERGRRTQLGAALKGQAGRVLGSFRVAADETDHSGRQLFRLEMVGATTLPLQPPTPQPPPSTEVSAGEQAAVPQQEMFEFSA
jgi:hypothetical protein